MNYLSIGLIILLIILIISIFVCLSTQHLSIKNNFNCNNYNIHTFCYTQLGTKCFINKTTVKSGVVHQIVNLPGYCNSSCVCESL